MIKTEDVRKSITATLQEIGQAQRAMGVESDPKQLVEAWEIICRIEARLAARQAAE